LLFKISLICDCVIPYISLKFLYVIFSLFLYISLISCACLKVIFDIPLCCPSCLAHLFLSTASLTFCLTSPRYKCFGFTHFLLSHVCNTHNPFFIAPLLIIYDILCADSFFPFNQNTPYSFPPACHSQHPFFISIYFSLNLFISELFN